MPHRENPTTELRGIYRDVLRRPDGGVQLDRGWTSNTIVVDCRRLLASFMGGAPAAGVVGLQLGAGLAAWDDDGTPPASADQSALVDPHPFQIPAVDLAIDFLEGDAVTATPTNRLQIAATVGPGLPTWPDADHVAVSLREFALVGNLDGSPALINYVTHPVIHKDPTSTLERTIWLVF